MSPKCGRELLTAMSVTLRVCTYATHLQAYDQYSGGNLTSASNDVALTFVIPTHLSASPLPAGS